MPVCWVGFDWDQLEEEIKDITKVFVELPDNKCSLGVLELPVRA